MTDHTSVGIETLSWGQRRGDEIPLEREGKEIAVFKDETEVLLPDGTRWSLIRSDTKLIANLGGGRVFSATPSKGRLSRSKTIDVECDASRFLFVNESKNDWIIDDDKDQKQAQFTGANHGVRHVQVELEENHHMTDPEIIFNSWVARVALESRMLSMTTTLLVVLACIAPLCILIYLL